MSLDYREISLYVSKLSGPGKLEFLRKLETIILSTQPGEVLDNIADISSRPLITSRIEMVYIGPIMTYFLSHVSSDLNLNLSDLLLDSFEGLTEKESVSVAVSLLPLMISQNSGSKLFKKIWIRLLKICSQPELCLATVPVSPDMLSVISPYLGHAKSRVRQAALVAVDKLIRCNPWKSTYSSLCHLMGREENVGEILIVDFFAENNFKINYFANLVFDSNISVRKYFFTLLISWIISLPDRWDIDMHLCPFLLVGTFDPDDENIRQYVSGSITGIIEDTYLKDHHPHSAAKSNTTTSMSWIRKNCRNFMPALCKRIDADFLNITRENTLKLLHVIMEYIGDGIVEYSLLVLDMVERMIRNNKKGGRINSSRFNDVVKSILKNLSTYTPHWWDLLNFENEIDDVKEEMLKGLLVNASLEVVDKVVVLTLLYLFD